MGIYGIGGKPGSGKTFWAVHHLVTRYYEWNKLHHEYVRRFPVEIVTNIDDLKLDHFSLDEMIEKGGGVEKFFTVDYQRSLLRRFSRIVYVIDEAGKYFPAGFKDGSVLAFFQYHRHMGIDIYLLSASLETLSKGLLSLIEYRLVAKERSRRVFNEMRYVKYLGSEKAGNSVLKKDQRIFALYRSMDQNETEKVGSVTRRFAVMAVVFVLVGFALFRYLMYRWERPKQGSPVVSSSKPISTLKSKNEPVIKTGSMPGGPLSGTVFKGGTGGESVVNPSPSVGVSDTFDFSDYSRVYASNLSDGERVVMSTDGRMWRGADASSLLTQGRVVAGALWVKRLRKTPDIAYGEGRGDEPIIHKKLIADRFRSN